MAIDTLHQTFFRQLAEMLSAENQILEELPSMVASTGDNELRDALKKHMDETKDQAARLENIIAHAGEDLSGLRCQGMRGILEEGGKAIGEAGEELRDAAIAGAATKVEHYEMAAYRSLVEMAAALQMDDALSLLKESLGEEEDAAKKVEAAFRQQVELLAE